MRWQPFCATCGQVGVYHTGDTCVRCWGVIEALLDPIDRAPLTHRPPLGVRILNRITGRTTT